MPAQDSSPPPPQASRSGKPKASSRSITKRLRFSPEEWAGVLENLAGAEFSETTRALLLRKQARATREARELERLRMAQLARWGNNLNQIARRANMGAAGPQILAQLIELERLIRDEEAAS